MRTSGSHCMDPVDQSSQDGGTVGSRVQYILETHLSINVLSFDYGHCVPIVVAENPSSSRCSNCSAVMSNAGLPGCSARDVVC